MKKVLFVACAISTINNFAGNIAALFGATPESNEVRTHIVNERELNADPARLIQVQIIDNLRRQDQQAREREEEQAEMFNRHNRILQRIDKVAEEIKRAKFAEEYEWRQEQKKNNHVASRKKHFKNNDSAKRFRQ